MLSIAIPLYNKAASLEATISSSIEGCNFAGVDHEIVVLNNASTDILPADLDQLVARHKRARCLHLPHTISAQDNWLLALNACKGQYLKLQLADDVASKVDLDLAISKIESGETDYVVGKTIPVFEAENYHTDYFDFVNSFRSRIHPDLTDEEKINLLVSEGRIFYSYNPFGDPNTLVFHRKCLASLNKDIQSMMPACTLAPDVEIYLNLFTHHRGCYIDKLWSYFYYYSNSPCVRRVQEPGYEHEGLRMLEKMQPLYFITSSKFQRITQHLTDQQKLLAVGRITGISRESLMIEDDPIPSQNTESWPGLDRKLQRYRASMRTAKALFLHWSKHQLNRIMGKN